MIKVNFISSQLLPFLLTNKTAKQEFIILYNLFQKNLLLTTSTELISFMVLFLNFYKKKKITNKFFLRRFFKVLFLKNHIKNKIIKIKFALKKTNFSNNSYLGFFLNFYSSNNFSQLVRFKKNKNTINFITKRMRKRNSFLLNKKYYGLARAARNVSTYYQFKPFMMKLHAQKKLVGYILRIQKKRKVLGKTRVFNFIKQRSIKSLYERNRRKLPDFFYNFRRNIIQDVPAALYNFFRNERYIYKTRKSLGLGKMRAVNNMYSHSLRKKLKNLKTKIFFEQQKKKNYLMILRNKKNLLKISPTYLNKSVKFIKYQPIILKNTVEFFNQLTYLINVNNTKLNWLTKKYFKKKYFLNRITKIMYRKHNLMQKLSQLSQNFVFKFFKPHTFKIKKFSNFKFQKLNFFKQPYSILQKNIKFFFFLTKKKPNNIFLKKQYYQIKQILLKKKIFKKQIIKLFFKPIIQKKIKKIFSTFLKTNSFNQALIYNLRKKQAKLYWERLHYFRKTWEVSHYYKKSKKIKFNTEHLKKILEEIRTLKKKNKQKYINAKLTFISTHLKAFLQFYLQTKFLKFTKKTNFRNTFKTFISKKSEKKIQIFLQKPRSKIFNRFLKQTKIKKYKVIKGIKIRFRKLKTFRFKFFLKRFKTHYRKIFKMNAKTTLTPKKLRRSVRKSRRRIRRYLRRFNRMRAKQFIPRHKYKFKFNKNLFLWQTRLKKKYFLKQQIKQKRFLKKKKKYKKLLKKKINLKKKSQFKKKINRIFKRIRKKILIKKKKIKKIFHRQCFMNIKKRHFLISPRFRRRIRILQRPRQYPIIKLTRRQRRKLRKRLPPFRFRLKILRHGKVQPINYIYIRALLKFIRLNKLKKLRARLTKVDKKKILKKTIYKFTRTNMFPIIKYRRFNIKKQWKRRRKFRKFVKLNPKQRRRKRLRYRYTRLRYRYRYYKNARKYKKNVKAFTRLPVKNYQKLLKIAFKKPKIKQPQNIIKQFNQPFFMPNDAVFETTAVQNEIESVNFCKSASNYLYTQRLRLFFSFIKRNKQNTYQNWVVHSYRLWHRRRAFATWNMRGRKISRKKKRQIKRFYAAPRKRKMRTVIAEAEQDKYNDFYTTRKNVKRYKLFSLSLHGILKRFMAFYQYVLYKRKFTKFDTALRFLNRNLKKTNNLKLIYSKFRYKFGRKELFKVRKAQRKNKLLKLKFKLQIFFRHFYNYKKNQQLFSQLKLKKKNKKIFNKILNDLFLISIKKKPSFAFKNNPIKGFSNYFFINKLFLFKYLLKKKNKTTTPFKSFLPESFKKQKLLATTIFEKLTKTYLKMYNITNFKKPQIVFTKKNLKKTIYKINKTTFFQNPTKILLQELNLKSNNFVKLKNQKSIKTRTGFKFSLGKKNLLKLYSPFLRTGKQVRLERQYKKLKTIKPFFENNTATNNYTLQYFKFHTQKQHLINTFTILESQLNILLYRMKFIPSLQLLPKMFFYNLVYVNNKIIRNPYQIINVFELIQIPYIITKKFYCYSFSSSANIAKFSTQKSIFYFLKLFQHIYNPYIGKIWIPSYFTTNISVASGFLHTQPLLEYFMNPFLKITKSFRNALKKRKQTFSVQLITIGMKKVLHKQKKMARRRKHSRHLSADYCLVKLDFFNFLDFYNNY